MAYEYVTSSDRFPAIAQEIVSASVLGEDLETTGFSPILNEIRLWSINTGTNVYVIDVFKTGRPDPIIQAHKDTNAVVVGQNLKFDQKFLLYHYELELKRVFDTFRASNLLYNGVEHGHNLWDVYRRELHLNPTVEDLGGSNWSCLELTQDQLDYAADDAIQLPRLRDVMKPKLAAAKLNTVALIEFNSILAEAAVELNGIYLNPDQWKTIACENQIKATELREKLWAELPDPSDQMLLPGLKTQWNLESQPQMLSALNQYGVKVESTAEIELALHASKHAIVGTLLDYRGVATQLKMFGPDFIGFINEKTGRVHPDYYPFLLSGRFACRDPNLAQIPREKKFRKCFHSAEGYVFVIADYSNIEMRIAAEVSGDETLIKVFVDNKDAHRFTASTMTGKKEADVTKAERQQAKPVNFGFLYGMQPPKLVLYARANYGVTLTEAQATDFRNKYFARFPGLDRWHKRAMRDGKKQCMAWSIGGRLRHLDPFIAYNEFLNHPVQATGADGLKASLRCCYEQFKQMIGQLPIRTKDHPDPPARMVHHVHDEIIMEVKDDAGLVEQSKHTLEAGMKAGMQPFLPRVPVSVEASSGHTWADKS